jgi:hypothetical protein
MEIKMITQDSYIAEALKLDWGLEDLVASLRASDPDWKDEFKEQFLIMTLLRQGLASVESKLDPTTGHKVDSLMATPRLKQLLKDRTGLHQI